MCQREFLRKRGFKLLPQFLGAHLKEFLLAQFKRGGKRPFSKERRVLGGK